MSPEQFRSLKVEIRSDESLKYHPSNKHVIHKGSLSPNTLFIGEAPGADEDIQGIPFVGRAGQLLDDWIDQMKTYDHAVINIVKCRPPNNRVPTKEEIEKHAPYTDKQILLLNPSTIVCLGATAFHYFFPEKEGILKHVGKTYEKDGRNFLIFPHPAYVLRNPDFNFKLEKIEQPIDLTLIEEHQTLLTEIGKL